MEGNYCYKFTTIKQFIAMTHAKDVEVILDIGVNIGEMSLMMNTYFPTARILGFEVVKEYFDIAVGRTKDVPQITIFNEAVTAQHRFFDDFGERPRDSTARLAIMKAQPAAGPGWGGGSYVTPSDDDLASAGNSNGNYLRIAEPVAPVSLDEIMQREGISEIDILKLDCEGCEHSVLGCASPETLRRIRFITGEYHGIARFTGVMRNKLFATHKVNLVGAQDLGCFFAERRDGDRDGLLRHDNSGMLALRPWLDATPMEWHLFDERFVLPADRYWHGIQ
jgi:FkbM family methyltransferase